MIASKKVFILFLFGLILTLLRHTGAFLPLKSNWLKPSKMYFERKMLFGHRLMVSSYKMKDFSLKSNPDEVGSDVFYPPVDGDTVEWEKVYAALQAYFKAYGNVNVNHKFVIQHEDFSWPEKVRGLSLGLQVIALQCGRYVEDHPERRVLLDQLEFPWEPSEEAYPDAVRLVQSNNFNKTMTALRLYREHVDHTLKVNKTYLIPAETPWPSEFFFMPLGNICAKLRENKEVLQVLSPIKFQQLELLGFAWSSKREMMSEENFQLIYTALMEYKNKYGHMMVPYLFEVPYNNTEWSESVWGMKLGQRVKSLRTLGTYTLKDPERKAKLIAAGFDFTQPKRREADFSRKSYKYLEWKKDLTKEQENGEEDGFSGERETPLDELDGFTTNLYNVPIKVDKRNYGVYAPSLKTQEVLRIEREENMTMDKVHPFRRQIEAKEEELLFPGDEESGKKSEFNMFETHQQWQTIQQRAHMFIRNWTENIEDPYRLPNSEYPLWWAEDVSYNLYERFTDKDIDKLHEVKHQLFDFGQFWWKDVVDAFTIYKRVFGHLNIPPSFKVTEELMELNIGFNMSHYNMKLGEIRAQLRAGDVDGYDDPVRRPVLDALGFEWGDMRHHLRFRFLPMMMLFVFMFSNALRDVIPLDYKIPDDRLFPEWAVHAPMGEWVQLARMQRKVLETFYPERIKMIDIFFRTDRIMDHERDLYDWQWNEEFFPTPDWLREKYEGKHPVPQLKEGEVVSEEEIRAATEGVVKISLDTGIMSTRPGSESYQMP